MVDLDPRPLVCEMSFLLLPMEDLLPRLVGFAYYMMVSFYDGNGRDNSNKY